MKSVYNRTIKKKPEQCNLKTTAERVQYMMEALKVKQIEFAELSGASRSLVNQWLSGRIKTIDAKFAFELEDKTHFNARWIILGQGAPKK